MSSRGENPGTDVNTVVRAYLASMDLLECSREGLCAFLWAKVAGEWYAEHSRVTSVRDGVVNVQCDSAPRAQQLQLDSPQIIKRLNEEIGEHYVTHIRASSAGIDRRGETDDSASASREAPTTEELEQIELSPDRIQQIVASAHNADPEFRDRLERIMLAQARVEIWRREHGYVLCPGCEVYHADSEEYCLGCRPPERPSNAGGEEGLSAFFE